MSSFDAIVGNHYGSSGLLDRILEGLRTAGKDPSSLTADDLVPVDSFHTRGRAATVELAGMAGIAPGDRVLDIGCGLGGTARHLAQDFGCRVDGIDLTDEYIAVGNRLTEMVGLGDKVDLRQGNALGIPHETGIFDVAWTEHVQMNIADKEAFYAESARVLKPGGRLLFHDIFRGTGEAPLFPVPWAEDPSLSFLVSEDEAREAIGMGGLEIETWDPKTAESAAFFEQALARVAEKGLPPLGINLLMGKTSSEKIRNLRTNLAEERVTVVMGSAVRKG